MSLFSPGASPRPSDCIFSMSSSNSASAYLSKAFCYAPWALMLGTSFTGTTEDALCGSGI